METNEQRKPTDAEVALFDRIVDGMMLKDGPVKELSCPKAAFRAWCLTVIPQYTDWFLAPTAEWGSEGKSLTAKALLKSGLVGIWEGREDLDIAANDLYAEVYDAIENDNEIRAIGAIKAALTAARQQERAKFYVDNEVQEQRHFHEIETAYANGKKMAEARVKALEVAAREGINKCNKIIVALGMKEYDITGASQLAKEIRDALAALVGREGEEVEGNE